MITREQIQLIYESAIEGDLIGAANLAFASEGDEMRVDNREEALETLWALCKNLAEENRYLDIAVLLWGNKMFDSRPSVVRQVFEEVIKNNKLIILGASSLSKCLGPDVPVLLFDGSIKRAADVVVGDSLMGDDSAPRKVLQVDSDVGPLYKITPERGEPWICNDEHILSLRVGAHKTCRNSGLLNQKWLKDTVKDISIKEYIRLSNDRKNRLKMFHVGVSFPEKPLPFDPYIYGSWLGDGCTTLPSLHTPDGPMARRWCEYWDSYPGMKSVNLTQKPGKCAAWRASKSTTAKGVNPFAEFMKTSVRDGVKFILQDYLINSRENRLKLLAGLIDSDGWLEKGDTSYGFVGKNEQFVRQVAWLARSLGYAAKCWPVMHGIKSIGFKHIYWHTRISGKGISEVPCLEKPAKESTSLKNMLNTGFKVEPIGNGRYHGFLIDGNHRFLLGDFTVTHNTYSCGVLYYLFWRMDPYWTAIKLAGPSEDHLYGNLFSHIVALHKSASIPMTADDKKLVNINETDMFISMDDAFPEMGIKCVLCKQNQISATGLRGHKSKPYRTTPHPRLGKLTRVYVLIDEGTHVSPGAFEDIKTIEASWVPGKDNVKIVMACNPEGIGYRIVQLAEPEGGWDVEQVDTLYKWVSKRGYPVLRLDGKMFENVVQRRVIYEGMMTYETFLDFLKSGEHSGPYWAKGRGFPPLKDNAWTIVPPSWPSSQRGEPIYVGEISHIMAVDTALGGSDKALCGIGRWGEAAGWTDYKGVITMFVNRANPDQKINKHVMVLDQIFQLPKSDNTVTIMQEVMGRAKTLEITPENTVMDMGGNASGVWSHAKTFWGDVLGVDSGQRASEIKILSDDKMTAYDTYLLMVSQLWYTMKRWLDPVVCAVLINPNVSTDPLFSQLTTRRYRNVKGGKVQVEPKHEYRARNQGVSPDEADVLNLLVAWCAQRGKVTPGIMEKKAEDEDRPNDIVSTENADEPDSMGVVWVSNKLEDWRE